MAKQSERTLITAIGHLLGEVYVETDGARDGGADLQSRNGLHRIVIRSGQSGLRDLRALIVQVAHGIAASEQGATTTLVVELPRISTGRVKDEWQDLQTVFRPEVIGRLSLVALAADGDLHLPANNDTARRLQALARAARQELASPADSRKPVFIGWSPARFAVWQVLLDAWLHHEKPLQMQELTSRADISYPTVAETVDRLKNIGELERASSRRAGLSAYPTRSLAEVLVHADGLRRTCLFVDGSGRKSSPTDLLKRIDKIKPEGVEIGGVAAARRLHPEFDLHGLPRVDLTLSGVDETSLVRALDPALRLVRPGDPAPLLATHRWAGRPPEHSRFFTEAPCAPLVEIVLDLYELRLIDQAVDFARAMHEKGEAHV